jgi:uncharacterized membrane protein
VIRSGRERLIQVLWFEATGVLVVSPLLAAAAGTSAGESVLVLVVLAIVVMGWAALFNTVFDRIEFRCTGRLASDRPHRWRMAHTIAFEASATLVTLPLLVVLTSLGWWHALMADIGLTLAYSVYGYLFHLVFDRLRPVRAGK